MRIALPFLLVMMMAGGDAGLAQDRPKLVVVLVVDQMRADYVERFDQLFDRGFRRLTEQGTSFTDAHHEHAFTATAPGHATLVTGVFPSIHGIIGNEYWDRAAQHAVYAVEDTTVQLTGVTRGRGRSPAPLLRTTVADWLREQSPRSKTISVSGKDRVAVLMGGHQPTGAYWYHARTGRFVTSTYYLDRLPDWVEAFNAESTIVDYIRSGWHKILPEEAYALSREDDFPAEDDSTRAAFPHLFTLLPPDSAAAEADTLPRPAPEAYAELLRTPYLDMLTFALARRAVEAEALGADEAPDLLFIGASASDYIGHEYGPYSQETQDHYERLDGMIGQFLTFLDKQVGRDAYSVVMTADHGVAMLPEEAKRRGHVAQRVSTSDFEQDLVEGLTAGIEEAEIYGTPKLSYIFPVGLAITFEDQIPQFPVTDDMLRTLRRIVADHLAKSPVIAQTLTYDELLDGSGRDKTSYELYKRSFHPDRAADIVIEYPEYFVFPASLPTNHQTRYGYDSHVPLIVVQPGRHANTVTRRVRSIDVAPTLATLLGIRPPTDLSGQTLKEIESR